MLKPKPSKPALFSVACKQFYRLKGIAVFTLLTVGFVLTYLLTATPLTAQAATNNTLNFQARLESAAGAIVDDGNYNIEFKLYNVSSGGSAEWTEDYLNSASQGVHVSNGYLTVNLGSITTFPTTINWDQQQWLTMNIGGVSTGSVTWDGEMNPRLQITAVPYALRAGALASTANASGYESTLSLLQPASGVTGNEVFQIPDMGAAGTYTLMTTTTGVQLQSTTPGSAQTGNFNISGTGILGTLDATTVNVNTTASQGVLTVAGTTSDSTAQGLVINDANGNDLLQVRNDGQVTLGKASGASSTYGKTNIGTHPDTGYTSLVSADKITTGPVNPTLNSISTWVGSPIDTTNNKYYLGIYTDNAGVPGTLIATSAQGTLTASSWNTLPVSASLSANTSYWLAFFTNTTQGTDPYQYYDTTATINHAYNSGVSFSGGLPSTFTSSGTSTTIHSIYASVSETGPLGTTLTVNPTNGVSILTPTSSTTAFQVQNASGTSVLTADTSNKVVSTDDLQVGLPANTNAGRLFSDSFESGNFNLWSSTSGPDTLDTANVHTGKYAAKFSPAGSGQSYIQTHINGSSTIDMRGYVYVSSQTTGSISFLTLCDSTCTSQLELYRDSSTGKLAFYNSNVPSNTNGSTVMTTGAWHEVEADITIGGSGTINVYLDGSNVISLSGVNTGSVNPTVLNAGDVGFGDTAVFSMDDIAVDTVRPGDGGNLIVGDSLHVSGTSTFGESLTIQTTTDATPALTVYNSDGSAGLQIMAGGSGGHNTFIGQSSGQNNTVNTGANTGMWNVSLGDSALHSNTSGYQNTAVGGQAMQNNTSGFDNVAFGLNALQANTSGTYNSAVGWEALTDNTTGSSNSAVGLAALQQNTTGADNTAIGQSALQDNQTANDNTAVGYQALLNNNSGATGGANNTGVGQYALLDNTSGSQLTGIGWGAGASNTTGSYNTYLGYNTGNIDGDAFSTPVALQNATAIGSQAQVQASNSLVLGAAGSSQVNVGIGTTIPMNVLSVSPLDYNTGSAAVTSAGTTVTGSSTFWRPNMVGEQFIFANGQTGIISAVTSYTSLVLNTTQPITAASNYRIQQVGFQVSSAGTVGIGTYSPSAKLQITANATDSSLLQVTSSTGGSIAQINANGDVSLGGNVTPNTVGLTTLGSTNAGGYGGIISAQKVTTGATGGTVASMSTYLIGTSAGSNIQFGIYQDSSGYPSSLVATSAVGSPVLGTNTLPISASLAANSTYWFVYWTNGSNNNNTYNSGSPANNWYFVSYGWPCASSCTNGMPTSFPVGGSGLGITFNVWATYEPAAALRINGTNGSTTVQNSTNSSTAFQVQNASGTTFFSADSTKDVVSTNDLNVGGPTAGSSPGRLFSDGFESGNTSMWNSTGGSGTISAQTTTVRNGKYAAQETTSANGVYAQSTITSSPTVYGREYFNVATLGNPTILMDLGTAAIGGSHDLYVYLGASGNLCFDQTLGAHTTACSATAPSTGVWHKLEVDVTTISNGSGVLQVWLDNTLVTSNSNAINLSGQSFGSSNIQNFAIGNNVASTASVFFDDISVDTGATGDSSSLYVADSLHVAGTTNLSGELRVQNAAGTQVLNVDTVNNRVAIGSGSSNAKLYVVSSSTVGGTLQAAARLNSGNAGNILELANSGNTVGQITFDGSLQLGLQSGFQGSGTIKTTSGSPTLTGTSTNFLSALKAGDTVTLSGPTETCTVLSVTNDTSATCTANLANTRSTGVTYTVTASGTTDQIVLNANGQVGIGTNSPTAALDVLGSGLFQSATNSTNAFQVQSTSGTNELAVDTVNGAVNTQNLNVGSAANLSGAGRIFSDSFESGNFNLWTTGAQSAGSSTVSIDTSATGNVHNGKYSVKFNESSAVGSDAYLQSSFTSSATSYSVRGYIYFSSIPAANLNLFRIYSSVSGDIQAVFIDSAGKLGVTNNGTGLGTNGTALTTGAWHEVEMRVTLGTGTSGTVSVYLDGVDQHDYTSLTTYDGTNLDNRFRLGEVVNNAGIYWADDFVVDSGITGTGLAAGSNIADSLHVSGNTSMGGSLNVQTNANTTQALLVQNASGSSVFDVDTANLRVGIGTATPTVATLAFSGAANRSVGIETMTTANTAGVNLTVFAATGNGTGSGGNLNLNGGTGGTSGAGGAVTISGGNAGGSNNNGGSATLSGGNATGTGVGGAVTIQGGSADNTTAGSAGGGITLNGAAGSTNGAGGAGGGITINGGNANGTGNNGGGNITLQAGSATGTGGIGGVLVKNASNSTTAFVIQNSSSTPFFTADTSSGIIQIGSATSDSTAILLQLDRYNQVTDPSGTNGAMYYNTTLKRFRCYQDGWYDCIGISGDYQRQHPFYSTDFFGASTPAQVAPWYGSTQGTSGSWAVNDQYNTTNHPGTVKITAGATSGGYSIMSTQSATNTSGIMLGGGETFELVFYVPSLSGDIIRLGFWDGTDSTTAVANGTYMEINSSGVASGKQTSASTTATTTSTYTISTGNWYRAKVVVNSAGNGTDYYIYNDSGTQLWHDSLGSTDLPSSTTPLNNGVAAESTTSNVNVAILDYMAFWEADQLSR